jgi:Uma2 family endonuclease
MSRIETSHEVEYPESDGEPLGETDLHIHWIIRVRDILKHRYRNQRVYVGADLMVYYQEGVPQRFVAPDVFVVLDCDPGMRRTFKTWEEGRAPNVVFEITSKYSKREDEIIKPQKYALLGVSEYFLYDPEGEYLNPPLIGYRLVGSAFERIEPNDRGLLESRALGITLQIDGADLVLRDAATRVVLPTQFEAVEAERVADRQARAAVEAEREAERQGREAAEAKLAAAEDELKRLRAQLGQPPISE